MKKTFLIFSLILSSTIMIAQKKMTPELLWQVERLSVMGLNKDQSTIFLEIKTPNIKANNFDSKYFKMPISGGDLVEIKKEDVQTKDKNLSPNGTYKLFHKEVHIEDIKGKDLYKNLEDADVYVFSDLDIRHWDTWQDGSYNHLFYKKEGSDDDTGIDVMPNEPYHTPQRPFGGDEDYEWSPDGKAIYYVSKKLKGKAYATSTNTDIYKYHLDSKTTENITEDNKGYDTHPAFSSEGSLAWLQMKTDGNESDKNDIVVLNNGVKQNLTARWDGTVNSFLWSNDGKDLYFTAPINGTVQLFKVNYPGKKRIAPVVEQLSEGQFDVTSIITKNDKTLLVTRTDMNHAAEIFSFNLKNKNFKAIL